MIEVQQNAFQHLDKSIIAAGMKPPTKKETGKIVRFSSDGNDKKNGWYIIVPNPDGSIGGKFGDWKTGYEKSFIIEPDGQKVSEEKKQFYEQKLKQMKEKLEKKQEDASTKAEELWNSAGPVDPAHPYLMKKRISHAGIKQIGSNLIIPLCMDLADPADLLCSLQFININGEKKFLTGGKVQGACHVIGNLADAEIIYLVEGYATGMTIHEATDAPVIVAFNAGNMKVVCQKLKDSFGNKQIIVAADNDMKTQENTGNNCGKDVADEIFEDLQIPYVLCPVNSDFNDLFNEYKNRDEGYQKVINSLKKKNTSDAYSEIIDNLNAEYAVTWLGNKCLILKEEIDPRTKCKEIQFTTDTDLRKYHANKTIQNPEDRDKEICIVDYWWKHPDRRQYKKVVFEPGRKTPGEYNLWSGFPIKPMKGDWSLFRDHIFNIITNGKDDEFLWVMGWFARILKNPGEERPGTSIVLRGKRGTGKGIFVNCFGNLLGNHYLQLAQQSHLLGKFNYHLKNKILVFADEGFWAGDKQSEGAIKNMITEPALVIEQKGRDAITVRNCINLIIASNNEWVVPAGLEERRFYVTDVSSAKIQNHEYFKALVW